MTPMGLASHTNELDKLQENIWPILVLQFLLAIAGNGYAIYRFLTHKNTWHTGMVYCFNLAVSDLLYACSLLPQAAYYYPPKHWRYGSVLCKLDRFFFFCNLYGSTFFVACISLNRYVAIVHPFFAHGRMEPYHAKLLSGAVWLLTIAISAPVFHFSTLHQVSQNITNMTHCLGSAASVELERYWPYSLFLSAFGCGLPLITTLFSCVAIGCTVVRNHNISAEEKCKVKALLSTVVTLYALFYLPFHVLRNLNLHYRMHKIEHLKKLIYTAYQITKIMVHFHICIHPLVYAALANSIQEYCCRGNKRQKDAREKSEQLRMCSLDLRDQC